MARFRLGLAGVLILSFLAAWIGQAQPSCDGMPAPVLAVEEAGLDDGRKPAELLVSSVSADDDLTAARRASLLRASRLSWQRIEPAGPSTALGRPRPRSTGPPSRAS